MLRTRLQRLMRYHRWKHRWCRTEDSYVKGVHHACDSARTRKIDCTNTRVGVRAAPYPQMQNAGELQVVYVGAAAGEESRIMAASNPSTDETHAPESSCASKRCRTLASQKLDSIDVRATWRTTASPQSYA